MAQVAYLQLSQQGFKVPLALLVDLEREREKREKLWRLWCAAKAPRANG